MNRVVGILLVAILTLAACQEPTAQTAEPVDTVAAARSAAGDSLELGALDFVTSVEGEAREAFLTGLLALHSFWYPEARDRFRRAQEVDPSFAMAHWGEAMTYDHPLWGPSEHDRAAGEAVYARIDSLREAGALQASEREQAYVEALRTLFEGGSLDDRREAHAEAMDALAERYPDDDEAAIFAALARMAHPDFESDESASVVPVAAPLEAIYQRRPHHPGVLHYLIHVYDAPTFAPMGLRPARVYAEVAPAASHALHMPSHIFRELEMWEKMAASNEEAYAASVAWQQETGRPLRMRDFHAYRWLFDAYDEMGRTADMQRLVDDLEALVEEARANGEDPGRMAGLADRLRDRVATQANASR